MFNKQLEYANHVVGEHGEEHIGTEWRGVGVLEGNRGGGLTRVEQWIGGGGGECVHMLIPQTHRNNILQASHELVMQGEHTIACGKISDGAG